MTQNDELSIKIVAESNKLKHFFSCSCIVNLNTTGKPP